MQAQSVSSPPQLAVRDVAVRFGGIVALDGIAFELQKGQILGLIGPNGAGKTTLFNCLSRLYTPASGDILYDGQSVLTKKVHEMPAVGIGRSFQNVALFQRMSVRDNIRVGAHANSRSDFFSDALRLPWVRKPGGRGRCHGQRADRIPRTWQCRRSAGGRIAVRYPQAGRDCPRAGRPAGCAAARRTCRRPQPRRGRRELGVLIKHIRDDRGVTVLLVEHHMSLVMSCRTSVVVMSFGKKIAEGTPDVVQKNPEVIAAYLGDVRH
jgi:branched-chain amino acid transport system ATP-binding protein